MRLHRLNLVLYPDPVLRVVCPPVEAFDSGRKTTFGASGLWARVIQHELDHLNGVLISDHGPPVQEESSPSPLGLPAALVKARKPGAAPVSTCKVKPRQTGTVQ